MMPSNLKNTLPTIDVGEDNGKADTADSANGLDTASHHAVLTPKRRVPIAGRVVIAVVALALIGAGVAFATQTGILQFGQSQDTKSSETVSPTKVEQPKQVVSKVDGVPVFYTMANRGTELVVTGEKGRYYTATYNGTNVLAEKAWLRLASEEQPTERIVYAKDMVPLFKTAFLIGDEVATLPLDTEVTVIDEKDGWLFVKTAEGVTGYGQASDFRSEEEKQAEEAIAAEEEQSEESWSEDYSYSYSNNYSYDYSNDNGSAGTTPIPDTTPAPPADGSDGGDIVLASYYPNTHFPFVKTAYADEGSSTAADALASSSAASMQSHDEGTILSDGVPLYLALLNRGDSVDQADANARGGDAVDTVLALVDNVEGTIPRALTRLEDDSQFKSVDAYAQDKAIIYADYQLMEEARECSLNDVLHLVDEYDDNYVIEDGGVFYYLPKSSVSLTELEEPEEPSEPEYQPIEETWSPNSYEDDTSYTETYTESPQTSAPATEPSKSEPEWTEPVL